MIRFVAVLLALMYSGCSWKTTAPTSFAVLGGGAGALGGPATAAAGAGLGAGLGQIIKGADENIKVKAAVKAVTEGDVQALLDQGLQTQKSTFDQIIDGIYKALWLACLGGVLWFIVPIVYSRYLHKKTERRIADASEPKS